MNMPERTHDSAAAAQASLHEQMAQQGEFPHRAPKDLLDGVIRGNLHDIPPQPEAMSMVDQVDVVLLGNIPGAYRGEKFYGRDTKHDVAVPVNPHLALPLQLGNMVESRTLPYGRYSIVDPSSERRPGDAKSEVGAAHLYHGKFHTTPDNTDTPKDYTIMAFPTAEPDPNGWGGESCTVVVKGHQDFGTTRDMAYKALPGLMPHAAKTSGGQVEIHPAGENYEIELPPEQTKNRPAYEYSRGRDVNEEDVREGANWLVEDTREAVRVAMLNGGVKDADRQAIVDKVLLTQEWQIQSMLNRLELSSENVPALRKQLQEAAILLNDEDVQPWKADRGIDQNTIYEARIDVAAQQKPSFPEDAIKAPDTREGRWYNKLGKSIGGFLGIQLDGDKTPKLPKAPKPPKVRKERYPKASDDVGSVLDELLGREPGEYDAAIDGEYDDYDQAATVEPGTADDDVSAVKVHTHKDRKAEPHGVRAFHRAMSALQLTRTEMVIGSSVEKSHRRVRRILGAGALALVGVAGSYLAFRSGGPLHGFGTAVADKLGDTTGIGHGLAPGANGELMPSTGGVGGQIPSDIPQTPSTPSGTDIMPPSGGPSTAPTPDQIPGNSGGNVPTSPTGIPTTPDQAPPTTPPQAPTTVSATPGNIPGTPQVPDVPKAGTGTFDPNSIGISTPTETLPTGDFHLNPGQSLSEYIREQMPHASTNAVYNEVARVMQANNLPVDWSAADPFEAARHIRPDMQLHI